MNACAACRAALPEGARFCPSCGARVPDLPPVAERKLATCLFADLVGSTELAGTQDPEKTRMLLDRFYDGMATEIGAAGGTIEKFAGDAVLAVFGVPTAQEDHADRALRAALSMRERLRTLFGDRVKLRIGVNSGEVAVGTPRSGSSFVSGDPVNVAARLEQAAAADEILAGERTVAAARSAFEFGPKRIIQAKGKPDGVPCRAVVRLSSMGAADGSRSRIALVARNEELELLEGAYRRAMDGGEPELAIVTGEPGVGKSRLVFEFLSSLEGFRPKPWRGVGRCTPYGAATAYQPLGEILRERFGLSANDPPERLTHLLAGREILRAALGLEAAPDLHPLAVRARIHEAWVSFVQELAAEGPTVLVIEDLHWADDALVAVLDRIVTDVDGALLVLVTARPEAGARLHGGAVIALQPLAPDETERMAAELLGPDVSRALRDILARAEGNPFFVEELVSSLIDGGFLIHTGTRWRLQGLPTEHVPPDSVHALLASRIDLLDRLDKEALQAAAVIGRVFRPEAVGALLGDGEPDLGVLEERDFVRASEARDEFAFKHVLTRDVAYAGIPKARRARLHVAFAEWLERTGGGRDEHAASLAHHYSEALRPDYAELAWTEDGEELARIGSEACTWLRRAGHLAIDRYEIEEGLALIRRALELAPSDRVRAELWKEAGRANALKYDGDGFWAAMERSLSLDADPARRADTYGVLAFETAKRGGMWKRRPSDDVIEGWVRRTLELAPPSSKARARALLAKAYWSPQTSGEAVAEAAALAERLGDVDLWSLAWGTQSAAAYEEGRFDAAYAFARRRLELLDRLSDPDQILEIIELAVPVAAAVCRLDEARELVAKSEDLARRLSPHHRMHALAQAIDVEELAGNWSAIRGLTSLVEERVAANLATPCVRNVRSLLLCAVAWAYDGNEDRARELGDAADELGMEGFGYSHDPPRIRLALVRGDVDALRRLLEARPSRTYSLGPGVIVPRLEALAAIGDRERVEEEAASLARPGIYFEPFALRALGIVRRDEGLIRRAVAAFEAMGLPVPVDHTAAGPVPFDPEAQR